MEKPDGSPHIFPKPNVLYPILYGGKLFQQWAVKRTNQAKDEKLFIIENNYVLFPTSRPSFIHKKHHTPEKVVK